jgi:serpin B
LENETREEVFFNRGVDELKTQMMRRNGKFNYTEIEELNSKLLEIPYSGDDISLYILLPNEKQGLKEMKSYLNDFAVFENSIRNMRENVVHVTIPKFKVEAEYGLEGLLSMLGMKQVFNSESDLSGIDGKRDLFVSKVIHKAVVEINEEGSEAAAVTAIVVKKGAKPTNNPIIFEFKADHPFLFFIRDNRNGMILFVGQINQL